MRARCEAAKLLEWLGEVLKQGDDMNVDVVVVDAPGARSSVQITLHGVPGPLAGLELSCERDRDP